MKIKYPIIFFIIIAISFSSSMAKKYRPMPQKENSSLDNNQKDNKQNLSEQEDEKSKTSQKSTLLPKNPSDTQKTLSHGHLILVPSSPSR